MFIGEVVPETLNYLRNNPAAEELAAFDHVIVDEYQDLNKADQGLLDLLISGSAMVIGDENQSIYGFRHAHPAGIIEFGPAHPPTEDADLDECRRCPTRVVTIANNLIMNNHPVGSTPRLLPMPGNPEGEVHIVQWSSIAEEAKGIADYVHRLTTERGYSARDILILTPRRLIAYKIRDALVSQGVSAHSFYHEEALEDDVAQRSFALLSLLVDPMDRVALRFWLGYGSSTWLAGEYAKLRAHCESSGASPREVLEQQRLGALIIAGTTHLQKRYAELVRALTPLSGLTGEPLVNDVFPDGQSSTKILRDAAMRIVEEGMLPSRILDELRSLITQPEMPEDIDYVRIMSLQKSKGLTSKIVIVSGCIQGLLPAEDREETPAEQAETLREQRRLFYVAITRPTEILVLSSFIKIDISLAFQIGAQVGRSGYGNAKTITTRFIAELGSMAPAAKLGDKWRDASYS
jgi:superfamily I DNA/RNA helicase